MTEDSRPLLSRSSLDDGQDEEEVYRKAPSIGRILGALSQGKLPDNGQLFTILHKTAAFLDSVSGSLTPDDDGGNGDDREEGEGVLSDDTAMILGSLLKEGGALARLLARWVYGEEAREEQKRPEGEIQGARGNEREQVQRVLWHLSQALSVKTSMPVSLEVDVPVDVQKAKENIEQGAKQVKKDSIASGRSVGRLISLVISSEELRRIPSDLLHFLRVSAANQVLELETRVDNVQLALRGPSGDGGGEVSTEKDFAEPDDALREAGRGVRAAVEGAATNKGKGKQSSDEANEKVDVQDAVQEQVVSRLARLIDAVQSDEQYQQSMQTLLSVSNRYLRLLDQAKEDVSATVKSADGKDEVEQLQNVAADGLEKAEREVKATLASTHLESQLSAEVSHHFVETLRAAKEVIEGLAGGRSLDEIVEKMQRIRGDIEKDSQLKEWLGEVNDFLSKSIGGDKGGEGLLDMNTEQAKEDLNHLYVKLQQLLQSRPDILEAYEDLKNSCRSYYRDMKSDIVLHRIHSRWKRIVQLATVGLWGSGRDIKSKASQITSMLVNAVIPSIGDVLGSVPIPRVEFTSDNIDAVVEDVVIPVVSLIPDTIQVTTMNDWQWTRKPRRKTNETNLDTNLKVAVRGFQLAISDISFYVQERFTAPSPQSCLSCCSFGQSQSAWCFFRGPSSWLSHTESALLDVGFWKKGLGVALDLSDAGQVQHEKKTKGAGSLWMDDTTFEGQRRSFFTVNNVDVQVNDSFDFRLRESRHWILNGLIRAASKPLIKIVLRRIVSAQCQVAVEKMDQKCWDIHYRAKRLAYLQSEKNAKWEKLDLPAFRPEEVTPSPWDYLHVLMSANAGKSQARIRMEEKEAEEAAAAAAKEEEEKGQQEQSKSNNIDNNNSSTTTSQQPKPQKTMEVKPSSIIKHDADGNYSISVGLTPQLLDASQRGPKTRHIRLRDDLVNRNYKNLADRPKQQVLDVYQEANVPGTMQASVSGAKQAIDYLGDVVQGTEATGKVVADTDGWKSDAFDL